MLLHLLLTPVIGPSKPKTTQIVHDFGYLDVVFESENSKDEPTIYNGIHCIVEDTEENLVNWLKPFDFFIKGNGVTMMEEFEIVHIK